MLARYTVVMQFSLQHLRQKCEALHEQLHVAVAIRTFDLLYMYNYTATAVHKLCKNSEIVVQINLVCSTLNQSQSVHMHFKIVYTGTSSVSLELQGQSR